MLMLYPKIKPYQRHTLKVSDIHELYADESGNPQGIPVLFVHGGPGSGCDAISRRFFDPEHYRIILLDQRGSGRSRPHAALKGNNTTALVADMERLRRHLKIERWVLFGGSWGSTLSLVYAETHPERVLGMVLRGIFLCRRQDLEWFYQDGASRLFPDHWQEFIRPLNDEERGDNIRAYYERLTGSDDLARMSAAKSWALWEASCSTLRPSHDAVDRFSEPHTAMSLARIEAHYFVNNCFMRENQILEDADRLAGIPGMIVHGRYDVVCPLDNALALHERWPGSELNIIRDAGHAASESGIIDALVRAMREMSERLREQT